MSEEDKDIEKDIELRSEEFQEVLGNVPPWILRRGITVVAIIVVLILIGSAVFKYPDIISTTMTLTGTTPPASLVAKSSGKLQELNVQDKHKVKTGDYLAIIENPANKQDILYIKKYLQEHSFGNGHLPEDLNLGNIQSTYSAYYKALFDYKEFHRLRYYEKKIDLMKERIAQYEDYYTNLYRQQVIVNEQFELSRSQYNRDSLLNKQGVVSRDELETARSQHLQGALSLENINSTLQNTEIQITQMRETLLDTEFQYEDKKNTLETQLKTYTSQLIAEIQAWEQTYVFIAPIDGEVTFTTFWVENQNVTVGEVVFTIVPTDEVQILGKASMPMDRSGKVKVGQKVNVRFMNFPDNEFGLVKGFVKTISIVPSKNDQGMDNYIVEVELPDGLMTTYRKELPYVPEMQAQADIITEDLSVLERFFMPLRKVLTEGFQ